MKKRLLRLEEMAPTTRTTMHKAYGGQSWRKSLDTKRKLEELTSLGRTGFSVGGAEERPGNWPLLLLLKVLSLKEVE